MSLGSLTAAGLVGLALVAGCDPAGPRVEVGDRAFSVEVRDTDRGREQGLSGRAEVPPGTGMLFVYEEAAPRAFWMSGMLVPIDLAWIADGVVIGVEQLEPCQPQLPCPQHVSPAPVDAVLEVGAGQLAGVGPGDPVRIRLK